MTNDPSDSAAYSIADATLFALRQNGEDVLRSSHRLLSYLIDMAADSPSLVVLERNCDQELLEPLVDAVCESKPPTIGGIRHAASRMEDLLVNGRAVSHQPAHQAVDEICRGVVRYLAERSGHTPPTAKEPATKTAPIPRPTIADSPSTTATPPKSEPIRPRTVTPPASGSDSKPNPKPTPEAKSAPAPKPKSDPTPKSDPAPTPRPQPNPQPIQKPKSKWNWKVVVAAVAAAIAVIVMLNRITVSFDGKGASGSMGNIGAWRGSEVSLPECGYTRRGYSFVGWELDGKTYQPGDTIKPDGSVTASAIWIAEITFDGNGADEGSVDSMLVMPGETITLPKIAFKRGKHRANGWEANGKLYKAGDEVTVDGPVTYSVDWGARVTFDGNGADGGETKKVYADSDNMVTVPKCGFTYADHVFKGWAITEGGDVWYDPGETFLNTEPSTLYAVWELDPDIMSKVSVEGVGEDWNNGRHSTLLFVTNNSSTPLELHASFRFLDASGNELESWTNSKSCVAPGETTLLCQSCDTTGFYTCDYNVTAEEATSGSGPLHGNVSVEEASVEMGKIVVRLTNNSSKTAFVESLYFYGKGYNGGMALQTKKIWESIAPGESLDVDIVSPSAAQLTRFDLYYTRQYYLDGYLE